MEVINSTCPVSLTESALTEFKRLFAEKNLDAAHGLRIGVKGGGCAGFSYLLGFDTTKEGDEIYEVEGLKIYMNKAHTLYLAGMEIEYKDGLDARGFSFNNPNADKTCGCGTSFSA
jgi:iron-sulfur cluster assembly protein